MHMLECQPSLFSHITSSNPLSKYHYIPVNNDRFEDNLKNYSVHPLSCYSRQHLSSANTIFFFSFYLKYRKTETDYRYRERDFPFVVCSQNAHTCRDWVLPQPGAWNSTQVSHVAAVAQLLLQWSGASHGAHWQEAGVVSRAKTQTQALWWQTGFLSGGTFTSAPEAHSHKIYLKTFYP